MPKLIKKGRGGASPLPISIVAVDRAGVHVSLFSMTGPPVVVAATSVGFVVMLHKQLIASLQAAAAGNHENRRH